MRELSPAGRVTAAVTMYPNAEHRRSVDIEMRTKVCADSRVPGFAQWKSKASRLLSHSHHRWCTKMAARARRRRNTGHSMGRNFELIARGVIAVTRIDRSR